jgi:hypothetical protein
VGSYETRRVFHSTTFASLRQSWLKSDCRPCQLHRATAVVLDFVNLFSIKPNLSNDPFKILDVLEQHQGDFFNGKKQWRAEENQLGLRVE